MSKTGQKATPESWNENEANLEVSNEKDCQIKEGVTLGILVILPYK